jgi:hypothetical protein
VAKMKKGFCWSVKREGSNPNGYVKKNTQKCHPQFSLPPISVSSLREYSLLIVWMKKTTRCWISGILWCITSRWRAFVAVGTVVGHSGFLLLSIFKNAPVMRVISRLKNNFHSQSHAFNYITFILQEPELLYTRNGMKLKYR